eukprot:3879635-Amphidinium_carterae.1
MMLSQFASGDFAFQSHFSQQKADTQHDCRQRAHSMSIGIAEIIRRTNLNPKRGKRGGLRISAALLIDLVNDCQGCHSRNGGCRAGEGWSIAGGMGLETLRTMQGVSLCSL